MEVSLIWEGQFIAATFTKNSDYLLCRLNSLNELCVAIGHFMYKGLKKIMFSKNLLNRIIKSRCQLLPLLCNILHFMPITNFTNDLYFIFTINVQPKAWAYDVSNFLMMLHINKKKLNFTYWIYKFINAYFTSNVIEQCSSICFF